SRVAVCGRAHPRALVILDTSTRVSLPSGRSRAARRVVRRIVPSNQKGDRPSPGQVQFLTVAEVATLMRVSKMTVYRLVHSGELPAARVGKSFRVPAQAVHAYLDSAYFDVG